MADGKEDVQPIAKRLGVNEIQRLKGLYRQFQMVSDSTGAEILLPGGGDH
jgi:hypothetical protein